MKKIFFEIFGLKFTWKIFFYQKNTKKGPNNIKLSWIGSNVVEYYNTIFNNIKPTLFDAVQHCLMLVWRYLVLIRRDSAQLLNNVAPNVKVGRTNTELHQTNVEYVLNVIQHRSTQFDVRCSSTTTMFNQSVDQSVHVEVSSHPEQTPNSVEQCRTYRPKIPWIMLVQSNVYSTLTDTVWCLFDTIWRAN